MKLLADLHTHSKYSRFKHAKNTIEEMAIEANEIGLMEIGITDHGYSHLFKTSKSKLKEARKIVDEINSWSKTKVLLGIEADIISEDGTLDIDNETLAMLDILIIGYHKMIFTDFANFFGKTKKTEEAKRKCTNAYINAINKYPVTFISHLDSILTTDMYEIGKACKERGTMIEINNRHTKWTEKQVDDLLASDCMFVVSSDAHERKKVGDVGRAFELIKKYNIPSERIANVEFDEDEKSELDRNFTAYKSLYDQLESTKKQKEEALEKKRKTEITGKLSAEMENELEKIARDKGLKYNGYQSQSAESEFYSKLSDDDLNLIKRAEEYIKAEKIKEFQSENDSISDDKQYSIDDSHPIITGFEKNFQAINSIVKESEEKSASAPSVELPKQEQNDNFASKNLDTTTSAFEQLESASQNMGRVQGIKNLINSVTNENFETQKPITTQTVTANLKKPEPEKFMQSITQASLASNGLKTKTEEPAPAPRKPMQRGGRGGGFIAVNSLIDDDK